MGIWKIGSKFCPRCIENSGGANFCNDQPNSSLDKFCYLCGAELKTFDESYKCECGWLVPSLRIILAKYCPKCGKKLKSFNEVGDEE